MSKTGHLVHNRDGHLVFKSAYPSTVYFQAKGTGWPWQSSHHGGGVGTYGYGAQSGTFSQRTMTRSETQDLFTMAPVDAVYAAALLLGADGYWYFYYYVSLMPVLTRVRSLSLVSSWDTGTGSNINNTGGLDVEWNMVGLRWRGNSLLGTYSLTGAVSSSSSNTCIFRGASYNPSLRVSSTETWVSW